VGEKVEAVSAITAVHGKPAFNALSLNDKLVSLCGPYKKLKDGVS